MVEKIERVRSKLEMKAPSQHKLPGQRNVHLCQAESTYVVSPFRSLHTSGRNRKRVRVERLSARQVRSENPYRLARNSVGPWCRAVDRSRDTAVKWKNASSYNQHIR